MFPFLSVPFRLDSLNSSPRVLYGRFELRVLISGSYMRIYHSTSKRIQYESPTPVTVDDYGERDIVMGNITRKIKHFHKIGPRDCRSNLGSKGDQGT